MNKIRLVTSCLFALLLGACATQVDTQHISRMESNIGRSEKDIVMSWGVPDKTYQLDARTKVITYRKMSYFSDNGGFGFSTCAGSYPGRFGYSTCVDPFPTQTRTYTRSCELSFNIVGGKAVGWFQNGNSCPRIR